MEITIEWIKSKKVIIYGTGKIQKDFEYIFDWISCEYYIDPYKEGGNKAVTGENLEEILVIVCDQNKDMASNELTDLGLQYGQNFLWVDDLLFLLDEVDEKYILSKNVYIWGWGETQRNLEIGLKKNEYDFTVCGYIDNNPRNWNEKIISPEDFSAIQNTFVIVASIYYPSIKKQLEKMGKVENKDFMCFSKFMARPSHMMKLTMYDEPIQVARCNIPFERETYTCYGIYPCCVSWVDYPVGNPVIDTCEASWNSITMKLYRLSMENRTYSFCKKGVCSLLPKAPQILKIEDKDIVYKKNYPDYPRLLALGLDDSCNLHCESCRNNVRYATGDLLEERKRYANDLISSGWLEKVDELFLSIDGEVFASEVDKMILFGDRTKRNSIHILTNGNLLNEKNWERLEKIYDRIWISISIDAASEDTYRVLRRGGNWKHLQSNLQMLSDKKKEGKLEYVDIRMVVQKKNYKEMIDFINMGKKYNFDQVIFSRISNYGTYTEDEYAEISMIDKDGLVNTELAEVLHNPIFKDKMVSVGGFRTS